MSVQWKKLCLLSVSVALVSVGRAAVLFEDDFGDGAAEGWNEIHGTWIVSSNEYVGLAGGFDDAVLSLAGNSSWSSYTIEARIKPAFTESFNDFLNKLLPY